MHPVGTPRRPLSGSPRAGLWLAIGIGLVALPLLLVGGVAFHFWSTAGRLAHYRPVEPSRLYAAPLELRVGVPVEPSALEMDLQSLGYRPARGAPGAGEPRAGEPGPGQYVWQDSTLLVRLHDSPPAGSAPTGDGGAAADPVDSTAFRGATIAATVAGGRVTALRAGARDLEGSAVPLGRPLLHTYYDEELRESRPVRLGDLPPHVVDAVLAAEDAHFFRHAGLSPIGIARAALRNAQAGRIEQGGSTITQQLSWNLFLSHERTVQRKAREAVLAMLLEARFSKRRILEAYLNEIYWGNAGGANLHGIGAAARGYFGKDAAQLTLGEAATLAGMIQAPAAYSPIQDARAARHRRDWVLERMAARRFVTREQAAAARAEELVAQPLPLAGRRAPWFAVAMAAEARQRFGVESLAGKGLRLLSTLSSTDQAIAERQVRANLREMESTFERGAPRGRLEGALVSLEPTTGRVLAWVGGRDWARSQFDRVTQAKRQAGSAFKPFVYAAAIRDGRLQPWELLRDSPIEVRHDATRWRPLNHDGAFHGDVTPSEAMAYSLNIPTVRVAMRTGLPRVVETAHAMGIESELPSLPSLSLGAAEVTPLELAVAYSTLASSGLRPRAWGLESVVDAAGEPLVGEPPPSPERVLPAESAYAVTAMLRDVMVRGTGAGAAAYGVRGPVAGKTGTTDDRRDSWFAGYGAERATVVWVGYDDNVATQLSGTRAALPVWSRFMARVAPAEGYGAVERPAGFVTVEVDPHTGLLATPFCPRRARVEVPGWQAPIRACDHELQPMLAWGTYSAPPPPTQSLAEFIARSRTASRGGGRVMSFYSDGGRIEVQNGDRPPVESPVPRLGVVEPAPGSGRLDR